MCMEEKMQPFPKQIPCLLEAINHLCPPHNHQYSDFNTLLIERRTTERDRQRGRGKQITQEMAASQKFKLFATPCGVGQSPRTSPLIQFRRQEHVVEKNPMRRHSLKALFVSSAPPEKHVAENETSPMLLASVAVPHCSWVCWTNFMVAFLFKCP